MQQLARLDAGALVDLTHPGVNAVGLALSKAGVLNAW